MKLFKHLFCLSLWMYASISFSQTTSVAVAANMKEAFTEINAAFKASGKPDLRIVYGSSGNFTTQILSGAPYKLLISADEHFPLELYRQGKTLDAGSVYAIGKLALIASNASGIKLKNEKTELVSVLAKANKVAIAKPELAPYGRAAVEYLKAAGLWDLVKDKLVFGDNISAATMFVATGAADIGFTALSLAQSPQISKETNYILLSEKSYEPITQRMVVIKGAPQEAIDLYQFMQSQKAKDILVRYGYSVPK